MNIFSYVIAFLPGASAQLNKGLASPVWAALFVYVSGLIGVMIMQLVVRTPFPLTQMKDGESPWWAWSGGLTQCRSDSYGSHAGAKAGIRTLCGADTYSFAAYVDRTRPFWPGRV
jgi:hypothetical protein